MHTELLKLISFTTFTPKTKFSANIQALSACSVHEHMNNVVTKIQEVA